MREDLLPIRLDDKFSHLIEECSELIKAICKLNRFGETPTDLKTGIEYDNLKDVFQEMVDVEQAIKRIREHIVG